MTLAIDKLHSEVEQIREDLAKTRAALESERAEHAATRKVLAAATAREAKLKAKLEQRGPLDGQDESWLMHRQATIKFDRSPSRGESVYLRLLSGGRVRARTLDEALSRAKERFGAQP